LQLIFNTKKYLTDKCFLCQELSEVSQIPDCVFVHTTGFIGGNLTKEGALQMAIKTMEAEN
jgi:uncharacterized UPF0160 family protein